MLGNPKANGKRVYKRSFIEKNRGRERGEGQRTGRSSGKMSWLKRSKQTQPEKRKGVSK
jgi:hypothetical protein